jgi:hypothetical protein
MVAVLDASRTQLQGFTDVKLGVTDEDIATADQMKAQLGELDRQWEKTKVTVGRPLFGFLTNELGILNRDLDVIKKSVSDPSLSLLDVIRGEADDIVPVFGRAAEATASIGIAAAIAGPQVGQLGFQMELASVKASNAAASFARVFNTQTTSIGAQVRYRDAVGALAQAHSQATGQAQKYADAQGAVGTAASDGSAAIAKAAADGAKAIAEARKDGERSVADAQENQAEVVEDTERRMADASRRAAEDIIDAQRRVQDAREDAARSALRSADRVADAQQALIDAATSAAGDDNPLEGQRRIEDAQQALARARRDAGLDAEDATKGIADAERELVEAQQEAARSVTEARREAAEAQAEAAGRLADAQAQFAERLADAEAQAAERVADARVQAAQRIASAQGAATQAYDAGSVSIGTQTAKADELVKSTFDAAFQIRQAGGSQAEMKAKVDEAKGALDQFGPSLGLTAEQIKYYKDQLDLIPRFVGTKVQITFGTLVESAQGLATNALNTAIAASLAGQLRIPQFAGGGTFHTPGGGAGLAVLHDGEKVLAPGQSGGGGNTIIINGSVLAERDILAFIDRAQRRGFRGGPS